MRSAPLLQVSVNHFGLWRVLLLLLAAGGCASMAAWWWAQPAPAHFWASGTAAAGAFLAVASAAMLWRARPLTLRWDRQCWRLAREGAAEQAGELALAIDLGGWMLLRFVPHDSSSGRGWPPLSVWFALQRRGLETQWHALRCAVYSARSQRSAGGDLV